MRKHRTPEQWQIPVDHHRYSGLSAMMFCKQEHIGYVSFRDWRKRLSEAYDSQGSAEPHCFVDLSSLVGTSTSSGSG